MIIFLSQAVPGDSRCTKYYQGIYNQIHLSGRGHSRDFQQSGRGTKSLTLNWKPKQITGFHIRDSQGNKCCNGDTREQVNLAQEQGTHDLNALERGRLQTRQKQQHIRVEIHKIGYKTNLKTGNSTLYTMNRHLDPDTFLSLILCSHTSDPGDLDD